MDCLAWLKSSTYCVTTQPRVRKALERVVMSEIKNCRGVKELGKYEFLQLFESTEAAGVAIDGHRAFLDSWFSNVKLWSKGDRGLFRRVWVELRGLPSHAWNRFNMSKIVSF